MRDWKTTVAGILTILVAVGNAAIGFITGKPVDWSVVMVSVLAGIGLIKAADSKKP